MFVSTCWSWCASSAGTSEPILAAEACALLVFIDDATSWLMQLRFVASESTHLCFKALRAYLQQYGNPVAFYSVKQSVFRATRQEARGGQGMTHFGRALAELNIEILCANSNQAKGCVERANCILQDLLVKELRLTQINDTESGNVFFQPSWSASTNASLSVLRSPTICTASSTGFHPK